MNKKALELISDKDGTLSHTKIWSNVACFSATVAFLFYSFKYELTVDMLIGYVGIVGLQRISSKFLDTRNVEISNKIN